MTLTQTVYAEDWYESMESSSMNYIVSQNIPGGRDSGGETKTADVSVPAPILNRDIVDSEVQKEIALQTVKEMQAINAVPILAPKGGRMGQEFIVQAESNSIFCGDDGC